MTYGLYAMQEIVKHKTESFFKIKNKFKKCLLTANGEFITKHLLNK